MFFALITSVFHAFFALIAMCSIRRSIRLAAKPRAANATLQAQSVLMRKLGLAVNVPPADKEAYEKYLAIFAEPLTSLKLEAIQMLFAPDFDPVAMNLN